MKIAKRVRDLPGGFVLQNYCDNCNEFMAFNRASDCAWVLSQDGEQIMACCCSIKCAKAFIKTKENERVPSAT